MESKAGFFFVAHLGVTTPLITSYNDRLGAHLVGAAVIAKVFGCPSVTRVLGEATSDVARWKELCRVLPERVVF